MSSNVNSWGAAIDHDGACLEDGIFPSCAPFAVSGEVFRELFSGSGKETTEQHLDGDPLAGATVVTSSSGGIPVADDVLIEDYCSSDEPISPKSAADFSKNETSATIHAMLQTSKHEREALFAARRKLADTLGFLRSKGFSEEDVLCAQSSDGFGASRLTRDEFGLPILRPAAGNPFVDKLKEKVDDSEHIVHGNDKDRNALKAPDVLPRKEANGNNGDKEFVNLSEKVSSQEEVNEPVKQPNVDPKPRTWAEMMSKPTVSNLSFDYCPMKANSGVVSPPLEVLKKGNEKLKFSIVGTFSKGTLPFKKVADFAVNLWNKFGLEHVSQKDEKTFVFRFSGSSGMHSVLSTGTWYIEKRPLLVHAWGTTPGNITHMPLWVRFDRVPDSYWTREGLSFLGSAIGKPLAADELTKKLEILPFAKLCVDYSIGDALPTKLNVEVLEPYSETISIHEVLVSYPNMPSVCHGCRSLGHLIGACPKTTRMWVRKGSASAPDATASAPPGHSKASAAPPSGQDPPVPLVQSAIPEDKHPDTPKDGWQTVSRKHKLHSSGASPSANSTPPPNTFKNLTMVDEIDAKHMGDKPSKAERKKLKRAAKALGTSPQTPS